MKKKYGIGLFMLFIIMIYLISMNINWKHQIKEEIDKTDISITTDGHALNEECYYLYEINGYVVVFLSDKKTPYEYTNILFEDLPELIRLEIQNGKYIKDTETLYGFLENYSS